RPGTSLGELRTVGRVCHHRVLERVLRVRRERDEAQELLILERGESRVEIAIVHDTAHLSEQRLVELLADDGRGLQDVLRSFAEPIDARGEQGLYRRRKGKGVDRRR